MLRVFLAIDFVRAERKEGMLVGVLVGASERQCEHQCERQCCPAMARKKPPPLPMLGAHPLLTLSVSVDTPKLNALDVRLDLSVVRDV